MTLWQPVHSLMASRPQLAQDCCRDVTAGQCRGHAGSTGAGASPGLSRVPSPTLPRHALPSPLDAAPLWRRGGQRSHPPGARARVPTRCRGPGVGTPPDATGPRPPRCSHTARRDAFCSSVRHGPAGACARARSCPWLGAGARATPAVRWWRHRLPHRSHCCPPPLPPPPRGAHSRPPQVSVPNLSFPFAKCYIYHN